MNKKITLLLLIIFLFNTNIFASEKAGTKSMEFLNIAMGARAVGLAEAYTAIDDDISALMWNPSALADFQKEQIGFTYHKYLEDIEQGYLGFLGPKYKYGRVAYSVVYLRNDKNDGRDVYGNPTGNFGTYSMFYGISYLKDLGLLNVGASVKFLEEKLYEKKYSGQALDLGLQYQLTREINLGASILNISDGVKYESKKEDIPLIKRVGAVFKTDNFLISTDYFEDEIKGRFAVGTEYTILNTLMLRFGYKTEDDLVKALKMGFGVKYKDIFFDYGLTNYDDFGWTHQMSLRFNIGSSRKQRVEPDDQLTKDEKLFLGIQTELNKNISATEEEAKIYQEKMQQVLKNEKEKEMLYQHELVLEKLQTTMTELAENNKKFMEYLKEKETEKEIETEEKIEE